MTKEHALQAYNHYKDLLTNPKYADMKKVWKNNVQHGLDSILIRHPEFAEKKEAPKEDISKEEPKKKKDK